MLEILRAYNDQIGDGKDESQSEIRNARNWENLPSKGLHAVLSWLLSVTRTWAEDG